MFDFNLLKFAIVCVLWYIVFVDITEVFKNTQDFKDVESQIKGAMFSHAYLFLSKDGASSKFFSLAVAKRFNCEGVCGVCPNCLKIDAGTHSDVILLPEKERFLVSDSKIAIDNAQLKPQLSKFKIFVFENFDTATPEAQNKILKLIEEPFPNTVFFICAKSESGVLSTIRSRCRVINLRPLGEFELKRLGISEGAVEFSEGWLAIAKELDERGDFEKLKADMLKIITELNSSLKIIYYSGLLSADRRDFELKLSILSLLFEDMLYIKEGKPEFAKIKSAKERLESASTGYSSLAISKICSLLNGAKREAEANVSKEIISDNLLMKILEVKYLCK